MLETDVVVQRNTAPIAGEQRRNYLWTMAEYFRFMNHVDIKARLPGYTPPQVLLGTKQNHRPDLVCKQPDKNGTMLLLETFVPGERALDELQSRWELFESAAQLYGADFAFVVPRWTPTCSNPAVTLRRHLHDMGWNDERLYIWRV